MERLNLDIDGVNSTILTDRQTEQESWLDNDFLLQDRIQKIQQIINQYGEDNFCISFSGGKDSTVLSALVDMALPKNQIPRVYANTGIELNMIRDFVLDMAKTDARINIIKPTTPIKQMLEKEGYPFKSKMHSKWWDYYYRLGKACGVRNYIGEGEKTLYRPCPKILRYQFTEEFKSRMKLSDHCCLRLKEEPVKNWQKEHQKPYTMIGIMREEGGRRERAKCLAFNGKHLVAFQPMAPLTKDWEDWFIKTYNIKICNIYYPPYNFERTGCKGCPFALHLQHELDTLEKFFPNERKQCELIWAPVYAEYRRLGYRLKPSDSKDSKRKASLEEAEKSNEQLNKKIFDSGEQIEGQMNIFDYIK